MRALFIAIAVVASVVSPNRSLAETAEASTEASPTVPAPSVEPAADSTIWSCHSTAECRPGELCLKGERSNLCVELPRLGN